MSHNTRHLRRAAELKPSSSARPPQGFRVSRLHNPKTLKDCSGDVPGALACAPQLHTVVEGFRVAGARPAGIEEGGAHDGQLRGD
eukprot:1049039-Pyramimonas_sp.AAC.2